MHRKKFFELMTPFLLFIILLSSVSYVATDLYLPSLPAMGQYFAAKNTHVQMTIACYLLASFFGILIFGPLSDYYGRKKIILIGMGIGFLGSCVSLFMPNIHLNINWILFGRIIQGFGLAVSIAVVRGMLADLYSGINLAKVTSMFAFVVPILLSVSPVIGGFLEQYFDWRAAFLFISVYILILWILSMKILEEQPLKKHILKPSTIVKQYFSILSDKNFMLHTIAFSFSLGGFLAYLTTSPYLLQVGLGLTPKQFGFVAPFVCSFLLLGTVINIFLTDYLSLQRISILGSIILSVAGVAMLKVAFLKINSFFVLISPTLIYVVGIHLITPNMFALAIRSFKDKRGVCASVFSACQILVMSIAGYITSVLPDDSPIYLGYIYCLCSIVCILCIGYAYMTEKDYED